MKHSLSQALLQSMNFQMNNGTFFLKYNTKPIMVIKICIHMPIKE